MNLNRNASTLARRSHRLAAVTLTVAAVLTATTGASAAPSKDPAGLARVLPTPVHAATYGAPSPQGQGGRHLAIDWFAPAGTACHAPATGRVVRAAHPGPERTGTLPQGALSIRDTKGRLWVLRNATPSVKVGVRVTAGQRVCTVTSTAGPGYIHLEVYRRGSRDREYRPSMAMNPYAVLYAAGVL